MKKTSMAIILSAVVFGEVFSCTNIQTASKCTNTTIASTKSIDNPTLRKGSTGDYVKFIQEKLLANGFFEGKSYSSDYAAIVNGKYNTETEDAVNKLQEWAGIPTDGVVGPETWKILNIYFQG